MRGGGLIDDDPTLKPGQIWVVGYPIASCPSLLDCGALAGADIVFYDRALGPLIGDRLPLGSYAEPLPAESEGSIPAISARALKLASEGWSVVQLVRACRSWRQRLRKAGAAWVPSVRAGGPTVRLVASADHFCGQEVRPFEPWELVDAAPENGLLALIVGPIAGGTATASSAVIANGLAG
jgi:hypothetical protein